MFFPIETSPAIPRRPIEPVFVPSVMSATERVAGPGLARGWVAECQSLIEQMRHRRARSRAGALVRLAGLAGRLRRLESGDRDCAEGAAGAIARAERKVLGDPAALAEEIRTEAKDWLLTASQPFVAGGSRSVPPPSVLLLDWLDDLELARFALESARPADKPRGATPDPLADCCDLVRKKATSFLPAEGYARQVLEAMDFDLPVNDLALARTATKFMAVVEAADQMRSLMKGLLANDGDEESDCHGQDPRPE